MVWKKKAASPKAADSAQGTRPLAEASTAKQAAGLPLFFIAPAALDKARHAKAGLLTAPDLRFAKAANSVTLTALEFIEASKFYPIVFTANDTPAPLAILGLEQENYFVDANGKWAADAYVPAYIRQYPFVFFENKAEQKFYLCVDEKSAQFRAAGEDGAAPLFNSDATPSALTNQALEFCNSYHQHHVVTLEFVADLKKHNLLSPYQSNFTLKTGRKIALAGFSMIDEKAFNALPEAVFAEFRSKGWLPFIYLALASTSNWKRLALLADSRIPAEA